MNSHDGFLEQRVWNSKHPESIKTVVLMTLTQFKTDIMKYSPGKARCLQRTSETSFAEEILWIFLTVENQLCKGRSWFWVEQIVRLDSRFPGVIDEVTAFFDERSYGSGKPLVSACETQVSQ